MKELEFVNKGDWHVCEVGEYETGCVVHVTLEDTDGVMSVRGNAPGMVPTEMGNVRATDGGVMVELAVPEGMEISLWTRSVVVSGVIV